MAYQCLSCKSIHMTGHYAEMCCPSIQQIPDSKIVMCWRCRGQGWLNCACNGAGIWLAETMQWESDSQRRSRQDFGLAIPRRLMAMEVVEEQG